MRTKLIEDLAYRWRLAENHYLETEDDSEKWKVKDFQDKQNLTDEELDELHDICSGWGI